mmetsp:Transcript_176789/g.567025  ORF Transcript_176789/g.567025 Transcript_176789/m.567025 type:complete len:238 (-) Transcript_176789:176-889(-)
MSRQLPSAKAKRVALGKTHFKTCSLKLPFFGSSSAITSRHSLLSSASSPAERCACPGKGQRQTSSLRHSSASASAFACASPRPSASSATSGDHLLHEPARARLSPPCPAEEAAEAAETPSEGKASSSAASGSSAASASEAAAPDLATLRRPRRLRPLRREAFAEASPSAVPAPSSPSYQGPSGCSAQSSTGCSWPGCCSLACGGTKEKGAQARDRSPLRCAQPTMPFSMGTGTKKVC